VWFIFNFFNFLFLFEYVSYHDTCMLEKQNTIGQEVDMGATKGNEEVWMRKKNYVGRGGG
jgi:hypothetical protein